MTFVWYSNVSLFFLCFCLILCSLLPSLLLPPVAGLRAKQRFKWVVLLKVLRIRRLQQLLATHSGELSFSCLTQYLVTRFWQLVWTQWQRPVLCSHSTWEAKAGGHPKGVWGAAPACLSSPLRELGHSLQPLLMEGGRIVWIWIFTCEFLLRLWYRPVLVCRWRLFVPGHPDPK